MGELFIFDLGALIQKFSADVFFETGTGYGFGVQFARMYPFRAIISVDIVASEIERLKTPFRADRRASNCSPGGAWILCVSCSRRCPAT